MRNITLAALVCGGVVCVVALFLPASAAADVRLTINNGKVTLSAKDATLRQILAEWSRVGQTKIVNAERVTGAPITIELTNVSEEQALDVILRSVSGYLAAPRSMAIANASRYDRILVMPTSVGTRASAAPPPTFQQPQFAPPPVQDDADDADEPQPANSNAPRPLRRGPVFNAFPPSQLEPRNPAPVPSQAPAAAPAPATAAPGVLTSPVMPQGVSIPGMVVPAPAPQPGQPRPNGAVPVPDTQ